ncbi:peptidase M28 family protein [Tasmannia lanceolata]|uniref:peptidase M28 family protein n=1 Tax=Tasmannia lanceolata TaxID=3420 RepID=UPI00406466BD
MAQNFQPKPSPIFLSRTSFPCAVAILLLFLALTGYYSLRNICPKTASSSSSSFSHTQDDTQKLKPHAVEQIFLNSSNNSTISSFLHSLTLKPHLAGTPPALHTLQYLLTQLKTLPLQTHLSQYEVLLSYPLHSSLTAHFTNGTTKTLFLQEVGVPRGQIVQPYHAYSPSGSAWAPPVYVNYGRAEDYRALEVLGVNVSGCVAVVRRGSVPRGGVVERAAQEGAVAVLLYAEGDGEEEEGIERGTVMEGLGDPLTPGWAAVRGTHSERLGLEDKEVRRRFPKIPSMPISAHNAYVILSSLGGPRLPYNWGPSKVTTRNKDRTGSGVGPGPTLLNFTYQAEKKMATLRNAFAVIRGVEEPDRYVLLGNHRDAWTYGAVDPNSGTAALLDIARRYALLIRLGWNPRRTIILCSWDAEEFGMIGSTEWVEQNLENLGSKAVAYLNVDCAVQGPGFFAGATPQLDNLIVEVTKKVNDPDLHKMTVYQTWAAANSGINIGRLGRVDSDFAAFLQHSGVPSIDLYYGKDFPVYHTAFDSYDWMKKYGDPLFHRHVAVAGIWGLLALHLADDPILPFEYLSYATQLQEHMEALSVLLDTGISLHSINSSIQELVDAANGAKMEAKKLREKKYVEDLSELRIRAFNDRLMLAERGFLEPEGLKGRQWFKHLIYGPPRNRESKQSFFPGIADAMDRAAKMKKIEGQSAIQHEIWRVARAIQRAAIALSGELS